MGRHHFSFSIRLAMAVAMAVAEEIIGNLRIGRGFCAGVEKGSRPVMLSYSTNTTKIPSYFTFDFEGGIVVKVEMVEMSQFESGSGPEVLWSGLSRQLK